MEKGAGSWATVPGQSVKWLEDGDGGVGRSAKWWEEGIDLNMVDKG